MNLRLALRDMARRPTFAAAIILTLTISLGATIAAFAFIDAVFLTRLPVRDQDRLVVMTAKEFPVPWETRASLAQRRRAFSGVTAFASFGAFPFAGRDGQRTFHVVRAAVAGNFFNVLGTRPELGRLLRPDDNVLGAPGTVVLSDQLWRRDFGADSSVVGRLIYFAREPHRVVGIAPREFLYPAGANAWVPVIPEFDNRFGESVDSLPFYLVGRLTPGVSQRAARAEFEAVLRLVLPNSAFYADWKSRGLPLPLKGSVTPFADVVLGTELRPALIVLFAAVLLVLVIAWANIGGLLLGRGLARGPELAVRRALGASRRQIAEYLLVESAVLAGIGGALGLALAVGLIRAAIAMAPAGLPMIGTAHVAPVVLIFALGVTLVAPLAFGLAPALRGASQAPDYVLRGAARSVIGGPFTRIARHGLVAAQVSLAIVVLSGAALLGRTLARLETTTLGFDPAHLFFFKPDIMTAADKSDTMIYHRIDRTVEGLNLPITSSVLLPFTGTNLSAPYTLDGQATPPAGLNPEVHLDYALDDYFGIMRIPLLRGRALARTDDRGAQPVAVVNDAFARKAWPGQDPLGHRIQFRGDLTRNQWWTVVGVSADAKFDDVSGPPRAEVYVNLRQVEWNPDVWYVLRTEHPDRAEQPLERAIEASDPAFSVARTVTGPSLLDARLARPRALATLFAALSSSALLLAAVGLFGVLSAYIRERRREIAVRSALGATPSQLRGLVLAQTLTMSVVGVACGVPLALGASSVLRKMVSDVQAPDALTIVVIAIVVIGVVAAAAYGPMIRASRIDPRTALAE